MAHTTAQPQGRGRVYTRLRLRTIRASDFTEVGRARDTRFRNLFEPLPHSNSHTGHSSLRPINRTQRASPAASHAAHALAALSSSSAAISRATLRNSYFCTLPVDVLGSSATCTTCFGALK